MAKVAEQVKSDNRTHTFSMANKTEECNCCGLELNVYEGRVIGGKHYCHACADIMQN